MTEPIENSGRFDLVTGHSLRRAEVNGTAQLYGVETEIDVAADELERLGQSYTWEETTEVIVQIERHERRELMTPAELQSTVFTREHFRGLSDRVERALASELRTAGIRTFADILALGLDAIDDQTRAALPSQYSQRIFGPKSREYLKAALLLYSGHALRDERATPEEQLWYYEDIREASPALALPYGSERNNLIFVVGWRRRTIGDLLDARANGDPEGVLESCGTEFVDYLEDRVVRSFETARAAAAAGGLVAPKEIQA